MKLKRVIIAILSILGILIGGGVAYATLGGTIEGIPVFDWMEMKFSKEYVDYMEIVENQTLEKDGNMLTLESTVCDKEWFIMQFDLTLNNDIKTKPSILSFCSDDTMGYNWYLIIDNEEYCIHPRMRQKIKEYEENKFKIYQMYFLTEKELKDKKEYKVTLDRPMIDVFNNDEERNELNDYGEKDLIRFDGKFELTVSREKADLIIILKFSKIKRLLGILQRNKMNKRKR